MATKSTDGLFASVGWISEGLQGNTKRHPFEPGRALSGEVPYRFKQKGPLGRSGGHLGEIFWILQESYWI